MVFKKNGFLQIGAALLIISTFIFIGCAANESGSSDDKTITAFSFTSSDNSELSSDVTGTISGTAISATVPYGTDSSSLIATFTASSGSTVTVSDTEQTSGTTANDFTSAVTYSVVDSNDNTTNYTVTVTVYSITKIIMFSTANGYDGNLGGRSGADAKVAADPSNDTGLTNVHALISVDASDDIANMPSNYGFPDDVPIVSAADNDIVIADNWADLTDGDIDVALSDAGINVPAGGKSNDWFSGSDSSGDFDSSDNCTNWTSNDSGDNGRVGGGTSTNLLSSWSDGCDNSLGLIGIAY